MPTRLKYQPRILITRLSHIGDCILTLPVLCAIRKSYPGAFIAWATEVPADQFLQDHEDLDELIVIPKGWLKSPREVLRVRSRLQSLKFDISIDPQSLTKSSALGWISGAHRRIGFTGNHGREASRLLNNHRVHSHKPHLVDRSLDLLKRIGITASNIEFKLPISKQATEFANCFVLAERLSDGFAMINPGCGWPSRRWEMDRYAEVAEYLWTRWQLPSVVVWAGAVEKEMAGQIVSNASGRVLAAPRTKLPELAALAARSTFYLGSDTGPTHIASAVGKPCIGLFGSTRPEMSGPHGNGHVHVQKFYQSGSSRSRRKADNLAMQAITANHVCEACDSMLNSLGFQARKAAA